MLIQSMPLAKTVATLRSGQQDLIDFLDQVLNRLDEIDAQVQAFVPESGRRERVLREAEALQRQYPDPANRPLLYGVPVAVKDIFRVDGLPTRAGSTLPPEVLAAPEASCVSILNQHGALVLGKTVTTEFAYFEPGPTRNPHNLAHTPGGSSSGSAAGVAAGLFPLALGTQTVGSVIRPAAFCGIVGFKPSYGRIDPSGVIFFSQSFDHVGLLTQDVAGMQLAASLLCEDWQVVDDDGDRPVLGVPDGPWLELASGEALSAFEGQVERLQAAGYRVVRARVLEDIAEIEHRHTRLMAYEAAQVHREWFAEFESRYRPRTAQLLREGQQVDRLDAQAAIAGIAVVRQALQATMAEANIDLWISPAAPGPAPEGIDSTGDPAMNRPWTHAGLPTVTVPAGAAENGMPLGLQCSGAFGTDEQVLAWAGQIEPIFQGHGR